MPHEPKIETALVCDDVRREQSGKDILIGVYTAGIGVPALPSQQRFAFWLMLSAPEPGAFSLTLRILAPQTTRADVRMELDISPKPDAVFSQEPFALFTPPLLLQITEPGDLELQARWGERGKFRTLLRKPIVLIPPTP